MIQNLIHVVTGTIRGAWAVLVTHPQVTIPGLILIVGTMIVVNRKARVHN